MQQARRRCRRLWRRGCGCEGSDAPKRLEISFQALWDEELVKEGPAREVWALTEVNGMVELSVELYDVADDSKTLAEFSNGFPYIISSLKSLVETGEGLPSPG